MSSLYKQGYTQNRDLSWLKFNDRVLSQAMDEGNPLLERLKFLSIFTSNLDEFFMIRVGSLFDIKNEDPNRIDSKSGMTPQERLDSIFLSVRPLYLKKQQIFDNLEYQLRQNGICKLSFEELEGNDKKEVKHYFRSLAEPILSPQIVDVQHPFPHLANKVLHIGVFLKAKNHNIFGVIPIPESLSDIFYLSSDDKKYIAIEDIVSHYADKMFEPYTVLEKVIFSVTRNADINPDDEVFAEETDFRKRMKTVIGQRRRLAPVRLELSKEISEEFKKYLMTKLNITPMQVYVTSAPLKMKYVFGLVSKLTKNQNESLVYDKFTPVWPISLKADEKILNYVQKQDILLSYPFESMDPFLKLIKEAGEDKSVVSVKITIYRLASNAKLVEYLCAAAENGKDVTVLIELRARFDEQNNIDWSKRLEEAGCTIIYGFDNYKVHSKICLITAKSKSGIKYITQVGTGNYNENTAKMYTDVSLITSNLLIGQDAANFFKNMLIGNLEGEYKRLLVAPVSLKSTVLELMDREIEKGSDGYMFIKINSLTDAEIIEKLSEASCAGVKVQLVVRGICCLIPGIPGKTENIEVISIVGRFLEHTRIYSFSKGESQKLYISSADFMTRNTERRVEVACPIYDKQVIEKLNNIIQAQLSDTVKARVMLSDGNYMKKEKHNAPAIDSQQLLLRQAIEQSVNNIPIKENTSIFNKIKNIFKTRP